MRYLMVVLFLVVSSSNQDHSFVSSTLDSTYASGVHFCGWNFSYNEDRYIVVEDLKIVKLVNSISTSVKRSYHEWHDESAYCCDQQMHGRRFRIRMAELTLLNLFFQSYRCNPAQKRSLDRDLQRTGWPYWISGIKSNLMHCWLGRFENRR